MQITNRSGYVGDQQQPTTPISHHNNDANSSFIRCKSQFREKQNHGKDDIVGESNKNQGDLMSNKVSFKDQSEIHNLNLKSNQKQKSQTTTQ